MFQPLNQSTMTQNTILTILEMVHCSMQIFAVFAVNPKLIYQSYHLAKHKGAQHQTISPLIMPWPFSFFWFITSLIYSPSCFPIYSLFCTFWFADRQTSWLTQQTSHPPLSFTLFSFLVTYILAYWLTSSLNYWLPFSITPLPTFVLIFLGYFQICIHLLTLSLCDLLTYSPGQLFVYSRFGKPLPHLLFLNPWKHKEIRLDNNTACI